MRASRSRFVCHFIKVEVIVIVIAIVEVIVEAIVVVVVVDNERERKFVVGQIINCDSNEHVLQYCDFYLVGSQLQLSVPVATSKICDFDSHIHTAST